MKHVYIFATTAMLLVVNCSFKSNPSGVDPVPLPTGDFITEEYPYFLNKSKDTLYTVNTVCSCDKDKLLREVELKPYPFTVTEDSLVLTMASFSDVSSTGDTVRVYECYGRNSGKDHIGVWILAETRYDSSLLVSDEDKARFTSQYAKWGFNTRSWINIDESTLTVHYNGAKLNFTNSFLDLWNDSLDDVSNISLTPVDSSTIQLAGNTTGQIVIISKLATLDVLFQLFEPGSSVATTVHTYKHDGSVCPNPYYPDWFIAFIDANALAKAN